MTDVDEMEMPVDGRVARRQRNIASVVDIVLELFAEEALFPTIEQASTRSGLSVRSLYRYFADPGELMEAAIVRSREIAVDEAHIAKIGQGPLTHRIEAYVDSRLRVHERIGSAYRASVANAPRHPRIAEELRVTRDSFRDQFERQFAPELERLNSSDRADVVAAGDALTQLDAVDLMLRHRELPVTQTRRSLVMALGAILDR